MSIDHQQLAESLDQLPAFPQSVNKIISLTAQPNIAPKDLVAVIEKDVILTARVLKLVNSSFFGLSKEVTSVQHAVVYVGINTIKNLAISVAMSGALPKTNRAGLDMDAFWRQSISVAVIAKLLAEKKGIDANKSADFFVAGLLHNIGKIVFAHFYPDDYREVLLQQKQNAHAVYQLEQTLLGIDHSEIGAMLAESWQLPDNLVRAIRFHHQTEHQITENSLSLCVFAASQIYQHINQLEAEYIEISEQVTTWLNGDIEDTILSLTQLDEEIKKAMIFIN